MFGGLLSNILVNYHKQMYKVFYNQKPIVLTTFLDQNSDSNPLLFIKYISTEDIMKALKSKKTEGIRLYHPVKEKLDFHFLKKFPVVTAAGGLVQHKNGKYLFIYRNDKWDLPKGKIEKKEIIMEAAVREVMEETGVADLIVKKKLPITYHIYNANGKFKLKKTHWFLMHTHYKGALAPQVEENIQEARWVTQEDIMGLMDNAYENIKLLVEDLTAKVKP